MGQRERQTPVRRPVGRAQRGRPAPHLDAAADELVEAVSGSRGADGKKSFCGAKNFENLIVSRLKILSAALEIKTGFSKSFRRRAPQSGLVAGLPRSPSTHVAFEGYGHAEREPKGL
jgi:hypothetical protein